jgi:hypothetical protein
MGLLERASNLCLILQNNTKQTEHLQKNIKKNFHVSGLLKKTVSLIDKGMLYTASSLFWQIKKGLPSSKSVINATILKHFKQEDISQSEDITYPYFLFKEIKEILRLEKASLFLFNRLKASYSPWAFCGLGQKDIEKIYFTSSAEPMFDGLQSGKSYLVLEDHTACSYLNDRSLAPLLIAPFIQNEKLLAFLLIFNCSKNKYDIGKLSEQIDSICYLTAPLIQQKREKMLGSFSYQFPCNGKSQKGVVMMLYQECKTDNIPLFLMVTSFEKIMDNITSQNEYINPGSLHEDLVLLINSLLKGIGMAFPFSKQRIIIFFKGYHSLTPQLLLHQIFLQIKRIYHSFSTAWEIHLPEKPEAIVEEDKDFYTILQEYL